MMNFELLAAAYLKAPRKPHKPQREPKRVQAKEQPQATEKPQEKQQEEPQPQPEEERIDSDIFTGDEIQRLNKGIQIVKTDGTWTNLYFTTPYNAKQTMIFKIRSYGNMVAAGNNAEFFGFIQDGKAYTDMKKLQNAYDRATENEIKKLIPDEGTAIDKAGGAEIEMYLSADYAKDAVEMYIRGEKAELNLYQSSRDERTAVLMAWMVDGAAAKINAEAYLETGYYLKHVAYSYIRYNRLTAELEKIKADPDHVAHKIKAMRNCITDEKTVKIETTYGAIIKADTRTIKYGDGKISAWYVANADRDKLQKDDNGRQLDILPEQVKKIMHGNKVLYQA